MELQGKQKFYLTTEDLWTSLHDPTILQNVIPGCQSMELIGEGEYKVMMKLGVAAVKGEYVGKVRIEDRKVPTYYTLFASGSGGPGHVNVEMDCRISALEQGSVLEWNCHADVGGKISSVGNRVLSGIAKFMADGFFKDLNKQVKTVNYK